MKRFFEDKLDVKRVNIIGRIDGGIIGLILVMNHPEKVKILSIMGSNLYNDNTSVKGKINRALKSVLKDWLNLTGKRTDLELK